MNIEEFRNKINASSLSDERKQKINTLLEGEVSIDIIEQIKNLIQEDIEADPIDLTDEDKVAIAVAEQVLAEDLAKIQSTLEEDMKYVEDEMNALEKSVQELDKATDEARIDEIKASF